MKRHRDALAIQDACNPSGIAHSIVAACREMRENPTCGTADITSDPAIRLMVHQLSYICRTSEFGSSLLAYGAAVEKCRQAD